MPSNQSGCNTQRWGGVSISHTLCMNPKAGWYSAWFCPKACTLYSVGVRSNYFFQLKGLYQLPLLQALVSSRPGFLIDHSYSVLRSQKLTQSKNIECKVSILMIRVLKMSGHIAWELTMPWYFVLPMSCIVMGRRRRPRRPYGAPNHKFCLQLPFLDSVSLTRSSFENSLSIVCRSSHISSEKPISKQNNSNIAMLLPNISSVC